jgi:hypothetical protein
MKTGFEKSYMVKASRCKGNSLLVSIKEEENNTKILTFADSYYNSYVNQQYNINNNTTTIIYKMESRALWSEKLMNDLTQISTNKISQLKIVGTNPNIEYIIRDHGNREFTLKESTIGMNFLTTVDTIERLTNLRKYRASIRNIIKQIEPKNIFKLAASNLVEDDLFGQTYTVLNINLKDLLKWNNTLEQL